MREGALRRHDFGRGLQIQAADADGLAAYVPPSLVILFNKRRSSVDCLVRDLSEHGAKLKFSEAIAVPEVVELYIPNKDESYRARVQWRVGEDVGVAFGPDDASSSLVLDAPTVELVARVRRLEGDVASLQRKVNELQNDLRKRQGTQF